MNSNRFVTSMYYPTSGELGESDTAAAPAPAPVTVAKQSEATQLMNLPTPQPASHLQPAYQTASQIQQQVLYHKQQIAYLTSLQQQIETIPEEPEAEGVYSSYLSGPAVYALPEYSMQKERAIAAQPQFEMLSHQFSGMQVNGAAPAALVAPAAPQASVAPAHLKAIPADYFTRNSIEQYQQATVSAAPVQAPMVQAARPKPSYAKMVNVDPTEAASGYIFEQEDEKAFTQDYNTLDKVPGFSPAPAHSEAMVAQSMVETGTKDAAYAPASFPETAFNSAVQKGNYQMEESAYFGFKNQEVAAYIPKKTPSYQNYTLVSSKSKAPSIHVETAMEPPTAPRSRFQGTIAKTPEEVEAPAAATTFASETTTIRANSTTGDAFRPVTLAAFSAYHENNMNDLVSCIDPKY